MSFENTTMVVAVIAYTFIVILLLLFGDPRKWDE